MNSPEIIYALRNYVWETFRQALASKVFWILLGASTLAIFFCFGISVEGGDNLRPEGDFLYHPVTGEPLTGPSSDLGKIHLLFGTFKVPLPRDRETGVHFLQIVMGSWVAGGMGLLLALVLTCGFVPDSLQPSQAAVLFAKPAPRWLFLIGKYLGVVLFISLHIAIFFTGTWLALGLKTGVWHSLYLLGAPFFALQFAGFFSVSVLLAVLTRSTPATILGSLLFWILTMAMNYGWHSSHGLESLAPQAVPLSGWSQFFVDLGYWTLPKPLDYHLVLERIFESTRHQMTLSQLPEFQQTMKSGIWDPLAGILMSLAFSGLVLTLAGCQLQKIDY